MNTLMKSLLLTAGLALAYPAIAVGPRAPQGDMTKEQHMKFAEEQFNTMDTNKDGKITAEERTARRPGRGMGPGASMPAEITKAEHMKWAEERFNLLDANKDGKITAGERTARRVGRGMGPGASMPAEVTKAEHMKWAEDHFNLLDANKDGKISAEERQSMRGQKGGMMRDGHGPRGGWRAPASAPSGK